MFDSVMARLGGEVNLLVGLSLVLLVGSMSKERVVGEAVKLVLVLSLVCLFV